LRNANFMLRLDGQPEPVVLRIYEHDASLGGAEMPCEPSGPGFPGPWFGAAASCSAGDLVAGVPSSSDTGP
jgi:hypothetical protein